MIIGGSWRFLMNIEASRCFVVFLGCWSLLVVLGFSWWLLVFFAGFDVFYGSWWFYGVVFSGF